MAVLDVGKLIAPIAGESPSGPNLEYDPAFLELEKAAQGKAEQVVGSAGAAPEPPDWNAVATQATALLERSKDLRVAVQLTTALLHRHGATGFAEGLAVVRGLLETQWPTVHPVLDPDDDPSLPSSRMTALTALTLTPIIVALRRAPLLASKALGTLSLEDIAPSEGAPDTSRIEAIFLESPLAELEACATTLKKALEDLQGIDRVFLERLNDRGPDHSGLVRYFRQAQQAVEARLSVRRGAAQAEEAAAEDAAVAEAPRPRGLSGDILSREDVVRALDKISAYYERHEPSSPVPLLVDRCKRLVSMSFLEIVGDLAPDAVKQANIAVGKRDGK